MACIKNYIFWVPLFLCLPSCHGYTIDSNPYRHFERLDERYELEWVVNWQDRKIVFNVTCQTNGYVGFGLSKRGKATGADIVVGGVDSKGQPYFSDRHAIDSQVPVEDESQDWTLLEARETGRTTQLSFERPFDTCDLEHDIEIHDDVIRVIWAFGETDDTLLYHYQRRGHLDVYLLDPDLTPRIIQSEYRQENPSALGDTKIWEIPGSVQIPPQDTTYLCSIHKAPTTIKNHIIGFNSIVPTILDRKHIHHFLLHRCAVPSGQDASTLFQRFHDSRTMEECYVLTQPFGQIPTQYCREVVYVWEPNGKPFFLPEHVGLPMTETEDEYYMLQMHFDNPEQLSGLHVNYSLEIFHTANLREFDSGVLTIGEMTPASTSIMVPPHSLEHVMFGHCGSGCTAKILPEEGIHVYAANLHTHLAGRGVRLIHIRNGRELPWVSYDNAYNFDYQQIRVLRRERTILPGDLLINRCVYENTDRNGSVTIGGFSSRQEMCNGFLWYYNRIPNQGICRSEIRSRTYNELIDINSTTWSNTRIENIVTSPERNVGLSVTEVGNFRINWNIQRRSKIQTLHRFLPQVTQCPPTLPEEDKGGSNSVRTRVGAGASRTSPPLQRYDPNARGRRLSTVGTTTARPQDPIVDDDTVRDAQARIMDPEWEFVTIYPRDMIPYERQRRCGVGA